MTNAQFPIQVLAPEDLDSHLPELAEILNACVHTGASVNFILPHSMGDSLSFWSETVRPAVHAGTRHVLIAKIDGRVAGTVQLDCDTPPNQLHRAEVSKLLVHPEFRRRGLARALMIALEAHAIHCGRSLLTLDTAGAEAEALYLSLGYAIAGAIPGYARNPLHDRLDSTIYMYKAL